MYDPMTQAFEIKSPFRSTPSKLWPKGYRNALVTIWHVDPETDGTDDSCGWFKRSRHGDKETLASIQRGFASEWDGAGGWFEIEGAPRFSSIAITLAMFRRAAYIHFKSDWGKTERFLKRRLYDILQFAENPIDSMHDNIVSRFGPSKRQDRVESAASTIYGCILRWEQPWYRHARWHVWHWHFQIHPWQQFRRWLLTRCEGCKKGFAYGESPVSGQWDHDRPKLFRGERGLYHDRCYASTAMAPSTPPSEGTVRT